MAGEVEFVNLRLATELQRLEGHNRIFVRLA